jgi:hypothetical protein
MSTTYQPEPDAPAIPRPGEICALLLAALSGSEGRRKRRKRNTTPDAIGMDLKRDLLARAAEDDPDPADFDAWLLEQCLAAGPLAGATRAMTMEIRDECRFAAATPDFLRWLREGAHSDDRMAGSDQGLDPR